MQLSRSSQIFGLFLVGFMLTAMTSNPVSKMTQGVFMNSISSPAAAVAFPLPIDPATAVVTSEFGPRGKIATTNGSASRNHGGIDLECAVGDVVTSTEGGTVEYVDSDLVGWGTAMIIISHAKYEFLYAHLSGRTVPNGSLVEPGEAIAKCGRTGNVSDPHLHLECRPNGGSPVNCRPYLESKGLPKR